MPEMKINRTEEEFVSTVKSALNDSAENLDSETQSRLATLRYQALAKKKIHRYRHSFVLPAGVFASLVAAILSFTIWNTYVMEDNSLILEDMDLLSSNESPDLLEDLEFYEWLESQTG